MEDVAMAAFTYPGVYIEEISSGQHTISGVATSIAAFVGWTNRGPVGSPTMVESWPQYEALFGGFIPGNYLGYAVSQFFANGGSQAYIVRLVATAASGAAVDAETASSTIGGLALLANNPGAWANHIFVALTNVQTSGLVTTFNLRVTNSNGQTLESFTNLSTSPSSSSYAITVVNNDSNYIIFRAPTTDWATTPPTVTPTTSMTNTILGSVNGSIPFTAGEALTQDVSTATATLIGSVGLGGPMVVGGVSGPVNATNFWVGGTSGAKFQPTSLPIATIAVNPVALNAGSTPTTGVDGTPLIPNSSEFDAELIAPDGYSLLANVPIFNLLCVPGQNSSAIVTGLLTFCFEMRAFLILDADVNANHSVLAIKGPVDATGNTYSSDHKSYGGFYYPWIQGPDPATGFRPTLFPPCGYVAGTFAWTDANRGVWKAPAGIQATLSGSLGLQVVLNDMQNGDLNPRAVNCLRQFPVYGNVVWGARTMDGDDAIGSQYKYVNLRRLANFIESSLYRGTQWVVFEPNSEPLWGQVRLSIGTFMQQLFLQGAFAGTSPQTAYFVKCDADNNPDSSVAQGIVNITVGFKPLDPAEFVVIHITQIANS
jgi:phage tail sheath protein FI